MIHRARRTAAALGLALAAGLAIVALPTAAHSADQAPTALWSEIEAVAAAQKHDSRVEVMSKATESTKVFANPDGTFTLEESLQPHRVRDGETGWKPLDTTLQAAGGRLQPAATVNAVSFSGGGDSPLATIEEDGKRVAVSWPGALPQPVLDGSTATYPEVLNGIDLKMTATATGFTQVLVVKSREAAANPALKELRLGLDAAGLRVSENAAGGLEATDDSGTVVFTSPTPTMWDSASSVGLRTLSAEGSVPEAKQAQVDVGIAGDTLTLAPDAQLLEAADTVYPVYIDPSWSGWKNNWTSVWKAYPGTSYWNAEKINWDDDDNGVARSGYESQTGMTVRSFFDMNLQGVVGKQVLGATMRITQTHNWSCSGTPVDLLQTGAISPSTTWDNQPWLSLVTTAWTDLGNSGCSKPDGDIEFDVTDVVKTHADNGWSAVTLALKAPDEGNTNQWKRFRNNPVIAVNYNSVPGTPTDLRVDGRSPSDPRPVIGTATPTLTARVHDADPGDTLTAGYGWYKLGTGGNWSLVGSAMQGNLRGGDLTQHTITTPLEHEGVYRFHVEAWDAHLTGPKSGWLEFEVDLYGPKNPPGVTSTDYGNDPNQTYGAIGKTGSFTFTPNSEEDIVGYRWGWNDPPTNTVAASGPDASATALLTPPGPDPLNPTWGGLLTLYVVSYDSAGRTSDHTAEYKFRIGNATKPTGEWKLDDAAGSTTVSDSSGNGHNATVNGAAMGAPGRLPNGSTSVSFDGVDDSLSTSGPALDTSKSFSVSAWVKVDDPNTWQSFLGQDGSRTTPFVLQYNAQHKTWGLAIVHADSDDMPQTTILSDTPAHIGVWTHLAAVYDLEGKARLYVNGRLSGSSTVPALWSSAGPLVMGAIKHQGTHTNYINGSISDVKVWDRVISAKELEPEFAHAGYWALDLDGSDGSGNGNDLTEQGSVSWNDDRDGNALSAAGLDGETAFLESAGPVLRTNASFEVSAWVKLTQTGGGVQAAASQDAEHTAAFLLGYDGPRNKWLFSMSGADDAAAPNIAEVLSDGPVTAGQWVHLVGRFDAQSGAVLLYVNGQAQTGKTAKTAGIAGLGPFAIGRAKWNDTANQHLFHGDVDDVQAFAALLPDASGANVALRAPASASSSAPAEWGWSLSQINDGIRGPLGWGSWSSTDVDHEEWVAIKLPGKQAINRVDLYPRSDGQYTGDNFPADFTIEVRNAEGTGWTPVVSRIGYAEPTDGSGQAFTFDTRVTDEVLIRGRNLKLMQFGEIEVYRAVHRSSEEALTGNLAFGAGVLTSSDAPQDWGWSPAWVNDARQDRGWSSWSSTDVNHTEWIEFSLASTAHVGRVELHARSDGQYTGEHFPANFTIQTWNGSSWVTVVSQTNYPKPTDGSAHIFEFEAQNTDRVRMVGTDLKIMIFAEVEIYGTQ